MINFVAALPANLEPNSIYYVEGDGSSASHFVADNEGNAIPISSETLVQAYMATLKGQANGYAELTAESTLPVSQLPEGSRPSAITDAITLVQNALQTNINAKADASAVYDRSQVDSIESALQSQIDAKQGGLANAADLAKIGNATFDGKPIILLTATEW